MRRQLSAPVRLAVALFLFTSPLFAGQQGTLDTTFNATGKQTTNFGTTTPLDSSGWSAILQASGKTVIVGTTNEGGTGLGHVALVRLNADGSQDFGFGTGGSTRSLLQSNELIQDSAQDALGRIIVIGSATDATGNENFLVARYSQDGIIDSTFSGDGWTAFTVGGDTSGQTQKFDRSNAVVVQADNKIIVAGYADGAGGDRRLHVVRLNTDGTLDGTWGAGGIFTHNVSTGTDQPYGMVLQPDGRAVVLGGRSASGNAYIIRLTTGGALDTTWNGTGVYLSPVSGGTSSRWKDAVILGDGSIVTVGQSAGAACLGFYGYISKFSSTGVVDTNFGTGGITKLPNGIQEHPDSILQQPDGKFAVGGTIDMGACAGANNFNMSIWRFNSNGTVDTTFGGGDGEVNSDLVASSNDQGHKVLRQADGSFILVGEIIANPCPCAYMVAAKYTSAGVLDTTYSAADGTPGFFQKQLLGGSPDQAHAIAVQASDGKIILAGQTRLTANEDFAMARYNVNGSLDTSFDTDGLVSATNGAFNDVAVGVAVLSTGNIILGGNSDDDFAVMRFNSAGNQTGGTTTHNFGGFSTAHAMAMQTDDKVVLVGNVNNGAGTTNFAIARFNTNGTVDLTATHDTGASTFDDLNAVAIQVDGKIVVAGSHAVFGGDRFRFAIGRYNANMTPDGTFGTAGWVYEDFGDTTNDDYAYAIAIQPDGKIVVGGRSNIPGPQGNVQFALARFNTNGSRDTTFNPSGSRPGTVQTHLTANSQEEIRALAIQFDGKIVAMGEIFDFAFVNDDFVIARYYPDGTFDPCFEVDGKAIVGIGSRNDFARAGLLLAGSRMGQYMMAGHDDGGNNFAVARFLGDPAPTLPGMPDLIAASDLGISTTDNITKDNTPTFTGSCVCSETVIIRNSGAEIARGICPPAGTYSITPATLVDGTYTISAVAINGAGTSAATGNLTVVIDTVALPPVVSNPTNGSNVLPSPTITGTAEASAAVAVTGGFSCSPTASVAGAWSCNTSLGIGQYTLNVVQTDIAGNLSSATVLTFRIKGATTSAVTTSGTPSKYGQNVTFTATVTSTAGTPGGSVEFIIDSGAAATVALSSGSATHSTTTLSVGTHTVAVNYPETLSYFGSNATMASTQTVQKSDSSVSVSSSASPSVFGQQVTFTIAVGAVSPGGGIPPGSVDIVIDGGTAVTVALTNGSATLSRSDLTVGPHTVSATYAATTNYNGSSGSLTGNQIVNKAGATVVVTPNPASSVFGQSVTFTAAITATAPGVGSPTGTVTFRDGAVTLGSVSIVTGSASLTTSALAVGTHPITAEYSGDGNFNVGASSSANYQVAKASTTTANVASAPAAVYGQAVTFTATVNATAPGAGTPTGNVTFKEGATTLGSIALNGSAQAQFSSSTLIVGSHDVTATYDGSGSFATSVSSPANVVISKSGTTTALAPVSATRELGQSITLTATVAATAPGSGIPTGNVTFNEGATLLGTGALNGAGQASLTTSSLALGSHTITSTYVGDANFATSNSGTSTIDVTKAGTTTTVSSLPNPSTPGQDAVFTIAVASGSGTPSGSVTLSEGATTLGTATLNGSGAATITISSLVTGSHAVTATYGGDATRAGSISATYTHVVSCGTGSGAIVINGPTIFCDGGSVVLSAPSAVSYLWSTGATTQSITATASGSYSVSVTDATSCSFTTPAVVVTVNAAVPGASSRADCNCDGKLDLIWRNPATGLNNIWLMNGTNYVSGASLVDVTSADWKIEASGDFSGDNNTDLVWRNGVTGENVIWILNGLAIQSSALLPLVASTDWEIEAAGDFNSDGKLDLVWRNYADGRVNIWWMNGTVLTGGTTYFNLADPAWRIKGAADFNRDGKTDLLWRNMTTNALAVWYLNGTTYLTGGSIAITAPAPWDIEAVGDYDGDGKADLVWRNTTTGDVNFWLMDDTTYLSGVFGLNALPNSWSIGGPR